MSGARRRPAGRSYGGIGTLAASADGREQLTFAYVKLTQTRLRGLPGASPKRPLIFGVKKIFDGVIRFPGKIRVKG